MFASTDQHLYIHVPYCALKCPYCDFNSIAGREDEQAAYVSALLQELEQYRGRRYRSLFIGGGTPTFLKPQHLETLLRGIRSCIDLAEHYEWTCEANPGSTDRQQLQLLKDHGVNRVSIGVQSTHAKHLQFLGRIHSADEAHQAIELACQLFDAVSCDLIFGLPDQSAEEIRADLTLYKSYQLQHASVYHLTIEPGTEFHGLYQRGRYQEIDQDLSWELLQMVSDTMHGYGLDAYETSNFAAPGQACLHNLAYWLQRDYDAVGAGAVSTVKGLRQTRLKHPAQYIQAITDTGHAIWQEEQLSLHDSIAETWMLGLRLMQGVSTQRLEQLGDSATRWQGQAQSFIDQGLLEKENEYIKLTKIGRPLQDHITMKLIP